MTAQCFVIHLTWRRVLSERCGPARLIDLASPAAQLSPNGRPRFRRYCGVCGCLVLVLVRTGVLNEVKGGMVMGGGDWMKGKRRRSSLELTSHGLAACCGAGGLAAARDWFWQGSWRRAAWLPALPCGLDSFIIDVKSHPSRLRSRSRWYHCNRQVQCKRRSAVTRNL